MESKTLPSFRMCLNRALQAMHIFHLKPTWRVWLDGVGSQELKDVFTHLSANVNSVESTRKLTACLQFTPCIEPMQVGVESQENAFMNTPVIYRQS